MMNQSQNTEKAERFSIPNVPILYARGHHYTCLTTDGEIVQLSAPQAMKIYQTQTPLVCHAPSLQAKLNCRPAPCFDILELFAFAYPAEFIIPTVSGLSAHLKNTPLETEDDHVLFLNEAITLLLKEIIKETKKEKTSQTSLIDILSMMQKWCWAPFIADALSLDLETYTSRKGFRVWKDLPEWSEHAPEPPTGHLPISSEEALKNLKLMLSRMKASKRDPQANYVQKAAHAFSPREQQGQPNIVMAEAGTGTGKTLGYIAPSQIWAQKNEGQVWLSTYTKNLQKQINDELDKAYPDSVEKKRKTAIRKGRENYLCLLNFEELAKRASLPTSSEKAQIMAGLLARWIQKTNHGDVKGGDLPGWFNDLYGYSTLNALSDQRGECIHAACPHFDKCFIEKNIRQSRHAEIVVANHALVMINNALAGEFMEDLRYFPTRYVFDEAHHLFHAADSAFASHLSGRETYELRRWILGQENPQTSSYRSSRSRGLKARMEEFIKDDRKAYDYCQSILFAARDLPGFGWLSRLKSASPQGATEELLFQIKTHVETQQENQSQFYAIEAEKTNLPDTLIHTAKKLSMHLTSMLKASSFLYSHLEKRLNEESDSLESSEKQKMEALSRSLKKRLINSLEAWISMLSLIETDTPETFLDWFVIERIEGQDFDYGFYRHWIDPTRPFIKSLENQTHGLVFTSATLTDSYAQHEEDTDHDREETKQNQASTLIGLDYFDKKVTPQWISLPSPFSYKDQARIFIINDLDTRNIDRVTDCYRTLFQASNGGGLGLFTSVQKLRAVHNGLEPKLHNLSIPLYTQHVDGMDISTLIDIFKQEKNSCLLGTDATRDGVDIPGDSLRLLIFDKVPWPRPDMLHKARRSHFGAKEYDERLTKMKLKQAFGRLIRTTQDKGVFVMLESRLPTRLLDAFPEDCPIERLPLKTALEKINEFLN